MKPNQDPSKKQATAALYYAMFAMIISFTVWASISPMASSIQEIYQLSGTQKSVLVAIPVLLGSIMRIPLGVITDRYGGRKVFTSLLLFLLIPTIGIGFANSFTGMIFWAFFIGMAGTSFAIAISYVSKFYPPEKQGLILGIVGMGNFGTAVAGFSIPSLVNNFGISNTFWILAVVVALTAVIFWFGTVEMPKPKQSKTARQALAVLKYRNVWILSLFYFATFGSFVAFSIYLPTLLRDLFDLTAVDAGLKAAGFVVVATLSRPLGGYLADRYTSGKVLNIVFLGITLGALLLAFQTYNFILFTIAALSIAFFAGMGNGAIFKIVPQLFPNETGVVTGVVGAFGGIGGFFPPIIMGITADLTGEYALGFILLAMVTLTNLIINRKKFN